MARAMWSGSIAFGLVSVPVRLFNATAPQDVRFHQFERSTGRRIHYRRIAEAAPEEPPAEPAFEDEPLRESGPPRAAPAAAPPPVAAAAPADEEGVAYEDLVKGYEVDRDTYVFLDPDELRALRPEQTQTIDVEEFVDLADIDPVYFEKSYYVAPNRGVGAEEPYALLVEAMGRAGKVAMGRFVLRTKEYLAAIRPVSGALMLETLFFDDEVRMPADIDNLPVATPVAERKLALAEQLISLLETKWDPARHRDTYRERVLDLLQSKTPARVAAPQAEADEEAFTRIPDLLEALRRSVEAQAVANQLASGD